MIRALFLGCVLASLGADTPPDELEFYESAREAAGSDPDAHVRLALWCEARDLRGLRARHLRTALELKPDHPVARGLLGQMDDEGEWRSAAEAIERARSQADRVEALARYDTRREQISDTAMAHWRLAEWCEQAGLKGESEAHLHAVVLLDPTREEAWKKLGYRKQGGRWVNPERLAAEKAEAETRRKAEAHWRPLLAKWKTWLGQPSRSAEASRASKA